VPPPVPSATAQQIARTLMVGVLVVAGLWLLREFIDALAWATVFAIALWPLHRRLLTVFPARIGETVASLLLTAAIAIVFIVPVVLLGIAIAREAHIVFHFIVAARHEGIPAPSWLGDIPTIGSSLVEWWNANLSDPEMVDALFGRLGKQMSAASAREYGQVVLHRIVLFFFTLLTVFFLFRDGGRIADQLRGLSDRLLGTRGERIAQHMMAAVHGTVTGLVLVGLVEGLILGIVYRAVELPYSASLGALTGVAAIIPFAAPVIYFLAGLYLFASGNTVGAIIVVAAGSIVVFVADHFVRPFLIGGAARLPFLWVLLGILGGLGSFGFLGLFLGPAVMAALMSLWREWAEPTGAVVPTSTTPPRRGATARPTRARKA
jgi:predicted PurR-regulated permease PerM